MEQVYILFCGDSIVRVFQNEGDAIDEELRLSGEYPEHNYHVKGVDVF